MAGDAAGALCEVARRLGSVWDGRGGSVRGGCVRALREAVRRPRGPVSGGRLRVSARGGACVRGTVDTCPRSSARSHAALAASMSGPAPSSLPQMTRTHHESPVSARRHLQLFPAGGKSRGHEALLKRFLSEHAAHGAPASCTRLHLARLYFCGRRGGGAVAQRALPAAVFAGAGSPGEGGAPGSGGSPGGGM